MRNGLSRFAAVAVAILLFLGLLAGFVHREVLNGDRFAATANAVRRDPAVALQVGEAITKQIIVARPDLVAVRPLLQSATTALVSTSAFDGVFSASVRDVHHSLVSGASGGVILRLADLGGIVTAVLPIVAPETAQALPPNLSVTLERIGSASLTGKLASIAHFASTGAWLFPLLALVAFAGAVFAATDRRTGAVRAGWGLFAAGAAVALAYVVGAIWAAVADTSTFSGAVGVAAWRQVRGDVAVSALLPLVLGLLIVLMLQHHSAVTGVLGRAQALAARVVRPARGSAERATRGVAVLVLGILLVLWPIGTLTALAVLTGAVVIGYGLGEVAAAAGPGPEKPAEKPSDKPVRSGRRWLAIGAVALVAAVLVAFLSYQAAPASTGVPTAGDKACNGSIALCSRSYDKVSFVATHNAMSAADEPGWYIPEQPTGVVGQLNAGVRVLLIDTYYGQSTIRGDIVATADRSLTKAKQYVEQEFGKQTLDSALRLRNALTSSPIGPVEPYMCHGMCEIGSTKWEPVMAGVRDWLALHPREVLTFFIEDNVTPEDTANVFRDAGLLPYVHVQRPGQPWPTLGEMIDSGKRVVVLMENHGGGRANPWLLQGFDWVQDTPYTNPSVADLSCRLNRGNPRHPLLLLNVWLSGFSSLVSNARKVNAYDVLWPYVQKCQRERSRLPNFVAVNFYDEGDAFRVVQRLNGLG